MMGSAKAHYDGIVAFSQTDFTVDLKQITLPVLVMHSKDDQVVPLRGPKTTAVLENRSVTIRQPTRTSVCLDRDLASVRPTPTTSHDEQLALCLRVK